MCFRIRMKFRRGSHACAPERTRSGWARKHRDSRLWYGAPEQQKSRNRGSILPNLKRVPVDRLGKPLARFENRLVWAGFEHSDHGVGSSLA